MKTPFAEIQAALNQADLSQCPELNIAVLRNVMLEPIEPYLRFLAYEMGSNARIQFGAYDNIVQEAVGGNPGLCFDKTACILVFMKLEVFSWELSRNFVALSDEQIDSESTRVKEYVESVLVGLRKKTNAMILWHGFEQHPYPALGVLDSQKANGQHELINRLNEYLRDSLGSRKDAYLVDLNLCLMRLGASRFYDPRYWHIGRAPYSREALREIALEDFRYIRALMGRNKKCLVLDCDNTLWGGIIGEDGLAGIQLGKTYPGSAYCEFQQEILNLHNRGIILALCSKNNEGDVWEVFRRHPDMVLQEKHIAAVQINWGDKASGLRKIAHELNIGLESMVFADDSDFEVNLVRSALPEVEVIHLPQNKAVVYRDILASCGVFDTLTLSDEDKKRGRMYKAEATRKRLQSEMTDMETYYKTLEMKLEICFPDELSISRVCQLTQKTNQFNLTTRRYSESDIEEFSARRESDVIYVKLEDKFGDSGIIGTCILRYEEGKAIIDTFLLSCRALGRGVEEALLAQTLRLAQKKYCHAVIGQYYATRRNKQVERFYREQGFGEISDIQSDADGNYQYMLGGNEKPEPAHFKSIYSEIDKTQEVCLWTEY